MSSEASDDAGNFFGVSTSQLVFWPRKISYDTWNQILSAFLGVFALSALFSFLFFGLSTVLFDLPLFSVAMGFEDARLHPLVIRTIAIWVSWYVTTTAYYFVNAFSSGHFSAFSALAVAIADYALGRVPTSFGMMNAFLYPVIGLLTLAGNFAGMYVGFACIVGATGGFSSQVNRWGYYTFPDSWDGGHKWGANIVSSSFLFFFLCHAVYMRAITDRKKKDLKGSFNNSRILSIVRGNTGVISIVLAGICASIMVISSVWGVHNNPILTIIFAMHSGVRADVEVHLIAPIVGAVIGAVVFYFLHRLLTTEAGDKFYSNTRDEYVTLDDKTRRLAHNGTVGQNARQRPSAMATF